MSNLPPYISRELILERLPMIFPEGIPNRSYCIRGNAASAIFVFLYIGAVEGAGQYLAPVHIYRMTDEQSQLAHDDHRSQYASLKTKEEIKGRRWYQDNTREPIRDETLKDGLRPVGAVLEIPVPTTSNKPRYYLQKEFAELFNPDLQSKKLEESIAQWQEKYLSHEVLARVALAGLSVKKTDEMVLVTFPNKEVRYLVPGPSSTISKSVIEVFATNFMSEPVVLWLSESGNKVVLRDDKLAKAIGINIDQSKNLPDIILYDLSSSRPFILFVEVVATDGPVTEARKEAMCALTDAAGFKRTNVFFLSAFSDRESAGAKKSLLKLAWGSLAWFSSEPNRIMVMRSEITSIPDLFNLM